ncbi:MAG: hemolysin III family protein [Pirellulales bacterium]|nr:hemolysin III family protein [Pirellulales bacterium]
MAAITPIPGFYEPFSSLSHLVGAGAFLVLAPFLFRRGLGCNLRTTGLATFAFGTVFLLSMSGTYHLVADGGAARRVLRMLDHAAIFVLIACSFTPIHIILFRGWGRWGVLVLIWGFAATAISLKMAYFDSMPQKLGLGLYLGMGWVGLGSGIALARRYGFRFVEPIFWGGVAYSIGALLEAFRWPVIVPGVVEPHEVFHIAVLIGLACHWSFVFAVADGGLRLKIDPENSAARLAQTPADSSELAAGVEPECVDRREERQQGADDSRPGPSPAIRSDSDAAGNAACSRSLRG